MGFCWRSLVTFCCYWQKVTRRRQDKKEKLRSYFIGTAEALYCCQSPEVHQNSALPTVRGCSSTSRMLLTPVRYITIRSKPRPKPACLQEP